jgi:SAM-dependent methyltransferase
MADAPLDPEAFNEFEARGWEGRAGGYHRFFGEITGRAIPSLLDAAAVRAGARVLDVACGPGYVAAAAAERGAEVTGIDVAAEMISLARRLNPGLDFRRGDAEQLPFEDGSFDAVVANFAVLHVGRPERMAAEAARVLDAGGRVAMTVWDVPASSRLLGVFVEAAAEARAAPPAEVPAGPDFFRFADDAEFAGLMAAAGLVEPAVRTIELRHHVAGADELWEGVIGGSVRTRALVESQDETTRARIRREFDALVVPFATERGLEVPVSIKLASARRAR